MTRSSCNSIRRAAIPLCGLFVLIVGGCGGGGSTNTQSLTATAQILYDFGATSTDAKTPGGVLIKGSDGNFYGTTFVGGLPCTVAACYGGNGTAYRVTPSGQETVLHLFAGTPVDGAGPIAMVQGSDGNFYGATESGGPNDVGTVFRLTPGGMETIIYSFRGGSDGGFPQGLIQASDGNFYGTTGTGGTHNLGTVFRLTPAGVETVLYSFAGAPDGQNPVGQLVQGSDGNFYGVTAGGGLPLPGTTQPDHFGGFVSDYGGTVFKVTPQGVETILHSFSGGADSNRPAAGLIQGSDGNFYGTTLGGNFDSIGKAAAVNTNSGAVYKLTLAGEETILHLFDPSHAEGDFLEAQLVQGSDDNLYGTAAGGGADGGGTAFQITPAGAIAVLYSFPLTGKYGSTPDTSLIQDSDGNLYGAAAGLGTHNDGYFFRLVLSVPLH